ncbi:MAG: restriction endonuclease subunit S [Campylobacter sp.]|nr:restriction endonuclease subunit S [Campylobacter sp.]
MFESSNGNFDIKKEHINGNGEYVITAGLSNNGILGKTDIKAKIFEPKTITIDMFGCAFYRQFQYKMVTHARVFSLKPSFEITDKQGMFLSCSLNFLRFLFGYENMCSWEKIKNHKIQLPITANGEIDFDFMESFIAELEAERVRELEAYLKATGLSDTTLSSDEYNALNTWNSRIWQEFKIGDLFEKLNLGFKKSKFEKDKDVSKIKNIEFQIPLVNAKDGDNGIMYYGKKQDFDTATMTIDIVNDGAVSTGNVYPQPQETGVLYNAYLIKSKFDISKNLLFFFATTIQKSIKLKFSYELKASWERVKNENIKLPITANGEIDFDFMENFIKAIQKLIIKDLVIWSQKKIEATKQVVEF